jgi:hypothetical protein
MERATRDLVRLIPTLVAAWRGLAASGSRTSVARRGRDDRHRDRRPAHQRQRGAAPDRLTPDELRMVAAGVTRLSAGLTRDRALAGARYMDDPRLLGAYLLF